MNEFLINPKTEKNLDSMVSTIPHAVLFCGPKGSGKLHAARMMLRRINPIMDIQVFEALPGKTIGIDLIREARNFLHTKNTSSTPYRAVIIVPTDSMTEEAQNALLKTLEEPANGSMIVLLCRSKSKLLATVLSRVQPIEILPIELDAAIEHYKNHDEADVVKSYRISGGAPELLNKLITQEAEDYTADFDLAKSFLTSSRFERLKIVEDQKDNAEVLIDNIMHIVKAAIQNPDMSNQSRQRFVKLFTAVAEADEKLASHVSKKGVLLELALQV